MSKNLIGIVTYGNKNFTELTINRIKETVKNPYTIFAIVGKPGDTETEEFLIANNILYTKHDENYGFPYSLNDIYDFAWRPNTFDNLIVIGNDVLPYPYAIDSLIKMADESEYEWLCAREYSVKNLLDEFPKSGEYFSGNNLVFNFRGDPWNLYPRLDSEIIVDSTPMSDVHNLALYKKSVFDKIGYIDVNFYPAYFEDNDYARRAVNAGISSCTLRNSIYFHFWSRTINQGSGGSDSRYFDSNSRFYKDKWGGGFGYEKYLVPFNNLPFYVGNTTLTYGINIQSREQEKEIIKFWRQRHG